MAGKNMTPEIRFAEFSEDWEQRKFSAVVTRVSSITDNEGLPRVEYEDIISGRGELNKDIYQKNSLKAGIEFGNGDVLFGKLRPYLQNWLLSNFKGIAIGDFWVLRANEADNKFIYYLIQTPAFHASSNQSTGTKMPRSDWNVVSKADFYIPASNNEQSQIGSFFKSLDTIIGLQQRKVEKLGIIKKSMLEKMFPQDGAKVPEVRFAGFTGEWKQRKLGDLCQIGDIDHKMPRSVINGVPYLMTGDFIGINDLDFNNSKLISNEDYEQLAAKIKPEPGDILFARYASVGMVRYVETHKKFLVSYSCAIIKHNDIANGKYLFYYLQANDAQYQIGLNVNTGSQRNIGIDSLKKLIIRLPQEKEQEKVAFYFTNLDSLITLHQRKLEKLKNIKQALLEKMFV